MKKQSWLPISGFLYVITLRWGKVSRARTMLIPSTLTCMFWSLMTTLSNGPYSCAVILLKLVHFDLLLLYVWLISHRVLLLNCLTKLKYLFSSLDCFLKVLHVFNLGTIQNFVMKNPTGIRQKTTRTRKKFRNMIVENISHGFERYFQSFENIEVAQIYRL